MTSRKEIAELFKDLPLDETWIETFMQRLKEKDPALHKNVSKLAEIKLKELEK